MLDEAEHRYDYWCNDCRIYIIHGDNLVEQIEMVYTRPTSIPIPTVWRRFTVRNKSYRIQDLMEDQVEQAMELFTKHFTADEPPCKYVGIHNHPIALTELQKLWRETIKDKLSLVCVEDKEGAQEVLGANVLTVVSKYDKEETFKTEDKVWAMLFGAVDLVSHAVNVFERYGVDRYLTAYGLVVPPKFRGMGIGKELLIARIPLCKALNIKVTATVFTAGASQAVAKKAGFEDLYEITYEELAKRGFVFPGIEEDTKSSKLMALVIE